MESGLLKVACDCLQKAKN